MTKTAARRLTTSLLLMLLCMSTGCALMHELQPHRLRRWNRQPIPYRDDPEMSQRAVPVELIPPGRPVTAQTAQWNGEPLTLR